MKRRALFVGVNEYEDPQITKLRYAIADASMMCGFFESLGYETRLLDNPGRTELRDVAEGMAKGLGKGDLFLFYFAGHGFTQGGQHLLFCRDDQKRFLRYGEAGLKYDLLRELTSTGCHRAFVLDACRSDFLTGTRGTDASLRDLRPVGEYVRNAAPGSSIAVLRSCGKFQCAQELSGRGHGLFTLALMNVLRTARSASRQVVLTDELHKAVAAEMLTIANAENVGTDQAPEFARSGLADVVLVTGETKAASPSAASQSAVIASVSGVLPERPLSPSPMSSPMGARIETSEVEMFRMFARAKREREMIAKLLDEYRSAVAGEVRMFEDDLAAAEEARACSANAVAMTQVSQALKTVDALKAKVEAERGKEPKPGDEMTITLPGGVPMTFCWCPATTSEVWKKISGGNDFFRMGSPESEADRSGDETRHRVKLTQGFWMGKYEVTQRQWEGVMGRNPSRFKGSDRPVEQVSWDDCQEFIRKINVSGKVKVSLPTEAQWEYVCRAGTTTPFNFGSALNGDRANCNGNCPYGMSSGRYRQETSPVGEYAPNGWGLYDMHGNVWEWCQDWYGNYRGDATDPTGPASGTFRVLRGGERARGGTRLRASERR